MRRVSDLGGDDVDGEAEEDVEEVKGGGDGPPCPAVPLARSHEAAPGGGRAFESCRSGLLHLSKERFSGSLCEWQRCVLAVYEEQCLRLWLGGLLVGRLLCSFSLLEGTWSTPRCFCVCSWRSPGDFCPLVLCPVSLSNRIKRF